MEQHLFGDLSLGARFSFINDDRIWVKISINTIAEWVERNKIGGLLGQNICSFGNCDHPISTIVNVL